MPRPLVAPTAEEIRAARSPVSAAAFRTPSVRFDSWRGAPGGAEGRRRERAVYLKLENLQPIGSFKIRGAANAIAVAGDAAIADGVWTASAGNMGQGVAWCAKARGVHCRVVVPDHAPRAKTDAVEQLGAEVIRVPFDAWWSALITRTHPGVGGRMIHPFADTSVMAGNGTIGLELAADAPNLDAVLVPWGGGGLACGIAAALRDVSPRAKVYAVEVETAAPLTASRAAGKPVPVIRTPTFIDGMGSDRVSDEMWPLAQELIAGTVVVTAAEVAAAVRLLATAAHVVAEGAGGAPLAAAMHGRLNGEPDAVLDAQRIACIVSGGNIDTSVLATILGGATPEVPAQ